jgi:hypothetical protein
MRRCAILAFILSATVWWLRPPAFAADYKLTDDDKIEMIRGLMAEFATVKTFLPRSKKALEIDSHGNWDKEKWQDVGREFGPAARVGDLVQITKVSIDSDRIVLEINNGMKGKGHWYDHVQIGMGTATQPVTTNQNTNAPSGTNIALVFDGKVPPLKAAEIKKMLAPVLDFDKHSATVNYVETLPAPVQEAIKNKKAIVGMDRDQVMLAMGRPRHKERHETDGAEMEDWIYGDPPGIITFVTFTGSKVSKVKEAYAGLGGSTAPPLPAH